MAQYVSSSVPIPTPSDPFLAVPTPFASHAFHPLDGYLQSVPYHLFIFVFPLHRWLYLGLFVFVNFWSILVRLHLNRFCI
jgi:sterol desaturase/sphingolipid hydroxylase (fatty acid hydroxylase superfamily)